MLQVPRRTILTGASLALLPVYAASAAPLDALDVRRFGAKGNGIALDTVAIQRAIDAAAAAGGGTVYFPKGRFLSFSLRLKSHVTLYLGTGAVLLAADPAKHKGKYDPAEPNKWENFQDYGHSYFHNSLIWGEDIEDIAILGEGMIDGEGLTNVSPNAPWSVGIGRNLPPSPMLDARIADHNEAVKAMAGKGNKAIALKNARNVTMRDIWIVRGGHFAILATGVDNLTIDNLKIDTNRDGIDIDVVRNCRISNCTVNSPTDDAIVLKSSFALGEARPTENVTITNCFVSGFEAGSVYDGTYKRTQLQHIERHVTSGRIKLGTESNGGFRNIAVSNCVFDCCNGLAIESVDGGALEDVVVNNLVMRDTTYAPIFLRLGDRRRAPAGTGMAALRRVSISDIDCHTVDKRYASIISGVPGGIIEDVKLSGLRFIHQGGGTAEDAARKLEERVDAYPEPDMFGATPSWGFYLRHVRGIVMRDIELVSLKPDARPAVITEDVSELHADGVLAGAGGPLQPVKF